MLRPPITVVWPLNRMTPVWARLVMMLGETALAGSTELRIASDVPYRLRDDERFTTLVVRWPDGRYQFNRILGWATDIIGSDAGSRLTMEDEWERDVTSATRVEWGFFVRFASDRLDIEWETSEIGTTDIPFEVMPNAWVNEPRVGGGVWVGSVNPLQSNSVNWEVTDEDQYTYVELESIGFPLSLVDRDRAFISVDMTWTFTNPQSLPGTENTKYLVIWIRFYDEAGNRIIVGGANASSVETWAPSETRTVELSVTDFQIPAGTRTVGMVSGIGLNPGDNGNTEFTFTGRNWGLFYSGSNLL